MFKKAITFLTALILTVGMLAVPTPVDAAVSGGVTIKSAEEAQALAQTLTPPKNFRWEVGKTSSYITLRWSAVRGAATYQIFRKSPSATSPYKFMAAVSGTSVTLPTSKGTSYTYMVKAVARFEGKVFAVWKARSVLTAATPRTLKRNTPGFCRTNAYRLTKIAYGKLGCAYCGGAEGPTRFDCSGFVYWVYSKTYGVKHVIRTSSSGLYSKYRGYLVTTSNLRLAQPGDIMLFSHGGGIDHAAIYWGWGRIIHASSSTTGVILEPIGTYRQLKAVIRVPGL